jgi:hypothetical protein
VKLLKYILLLLFVFVGLSSQIEAKVITVENEKIATFSEQTFERHTKETKWLGLLYLQEEAVLKNQIPLSDFSTKSLNQYFSEELCFKSIKSSSKLGFEFSQNLTNHRKEYENIGAVFYSDPELVNCWKVLKEVNLGNDIAKDITALTKARRYVDNGLIIESGGVVKQADGTIIGKLDNTDVYNPGELKVKGEYSGRHFDPDDAGGAITKKDWSSVTIEQSGIDDISTHLSRFEDIDGDNAFMIERLKKIKNGEISATDYDKRFYTHELDEYSRYKNKGIADGINDEDFYYNAHTASLESYSINEIQAPLYYPK